MSFHPPTSVLSDTRFPLCIGECITLPDQSVREFLTQLPLPGVVIFVHGVNSDGEWFDAAEEGLCKGLNNRLARNSAQMKYDGVEAGELTPVLYTDEIDSEGFLVRGRNDKNFIDPAPHFSPVIRFRWGYKADMESVKEWGDKVWLNEHDYWGGGPFANGCTSLADLWSEGLYDRLFFWITAQHLNPVPGRDAYSCPHRAYYVHAALRLAKLIASIRRKQADCPVTVVCHSQGNMIGMAAAFLGEATGAVADTYVLANPPYSLEEFNGFDDFSQRYTQNAKGEYGRQTGKARVQTLKSFFDIIRSRQTCKQPPETIDRSMANETPQDGSAGFTAEADLVCYGLNGNTYGRVTLYCNPHDQVISASTVKGIGWLGLSSEQIAQTGGASVFSQRVFAQGWKVGELGTYDYWGHREELNAERNASGAGFWFPASKTARYSVESGLRSSQSVAGKVGTVAGAPLAWLVTSMTDPPINADPPRPWTIPVEAPPLPEPFIPQSRRYGEDSDAFDEEHDPEAAARNSSKAPLSPDDPYDRFSAPLDENGQAKVVPRGSEQTEAELRYAHRARLRMEARREKLAAADGSVPGEAGPDAGESNEVSDDYRKWRTERISQFLTETINQNATDHSTTMTHPMHAEKALAYDVAVGVCRLTQDDWHKLRIEADWRYASTLKRGHPSYELSEYFLNGTMNGDSVERWAEGGEASRPEKIVDERSHPRYDPLESRT